MMSPPKHTWAMADGDHAGQGSPSFSQLNVTNTILLLVPFQPNTKISKGKWEMGTGCSRYQQPALKTPETQGSATSLTSVPWAAAVQPRCSLPAPLEITAPH